MRCGVVLGDARGSLGIKRQRRQGHGLGPALGLGEAPRQDRDRARVRQPMAASVALKAGQQRAGSVPKLVFQVIGMPRPVANSPMLGSVALNADFEARGMGTS